MKPSEHSGVNSKIYERELGFSKPCTVFGAAKGSLEFIERLGKWRVLTGHDGCVNTISWNENGDTILSGSDDCHLKIYHVGKNKILESIRSGHRANIFSAKFIPFSSDRKIVSCCGGGMIHYNEIGINSYYGQNYFNCHAGTTYELAVIPGDPNTFLTCGEDGTVRHFDLRIKSNCYCQECKDDIIIERQNAITSITVNPMTPYHLGVGCEDSFVRIFDMRAISRDRSNSLSRNNSGLLSCFKPSSLKQSSCRVTSLRYDEVGESLLASYCTDYVYLFALKNQDKGFENERNENASSFEVLGEGASAKRLPPIKRLRLRGDWSDTGPNARPDYEQESREQPTHSLMQRISDVFTRWLEDAFNEGINQSRHESATNEETEGGYENRDMSNSEAGSSFESREPMRHASVETEANAIVRVCQETEGNAVAHEFEKTEGNTVTQSCQGAEVKIIAGDCQKKGENVLGRDFQKTEWNLGAQFCQKAQKSAIAREHQKEEPINFKPAASLNDVRQENKLLYSKSVEKESDDCKSNELGKNDPSSLPNSNYRGDPVEGEDNNSACNRSFVDALDENNSKAIRKDAISKDELQKSNLGNNKEIAGNSAIENLTDESVNLKYVFREDSLTGLSNEGKTVEDTGPEELVNSQTYIPFTSGIQDASFDENLIEMQSKSKVEGILPDDGSFVERNANQSEKNEGDSQAAKEYMLVNCKDSCDVLETKGDLTEELIIKKRINLSASQSESNILDEGRTHLLHSCDQSTSDAACSYKKVDSPYDTAGKCAVDQARTDGIETEDKYTSDDDMARRRHTAATRIQRCFRLQKNKTVLEVDNGDEESNFIIAQPLMCFRGHRNARTMIKEAGFWGKDFVLSGSDCGRVFIWNRHSGALVTLLEADRHVVNCVQPHPFDPFLATSGIDYDIKVWAPILTEPTSLNGADEIISRNEQMLEESRDTITVPASFMLRMLASLSRVRNQRRREEQENESNEGSDED